MTSVPPGAAWPLLALRLRSGELDLHAVTEADMVELAALVPPDLELDPAATRYAALGEAVQRSVVVRQTYWRAWGTWQPSSWHLHFAVRWRGELIGEQELEGQDFPTLRTVDSSSWLRPEFRGRGLGTRMRTAVLSLAFGPLGAVAAVTSAWHDNTASLGVSRRLGYADNGVTLHPRAPDGRPDPMVHLRLTRERWEAGPGAREPVVVEGLEPCRPFFGLT